MGSFHLTIKSGKKGTAENHAAYIAREGKHGKNGRQSDLMATSYGNMPDWAADDPSFFFKMADKFERVNGAAYREHEMALPRELSREQQLELVDLFVRAVIGDRPYLCAIHAPTAALGETEQPHLHAMSSDRISDGIDRTPDQHFRRHNPAHPELGGCKKHSGGKSPAALREEVTATRQTCAQLQNAILEKYGHDVRVDSRSHQARGIAREPERHLGQARIKKMPPEERALFNAMRQSAPVPRCELPTHST